ncbi:MAG TPA: TonB-dependent receptor, partial [Bacteroidia bacterium]|nr:TonB-dependent receptor [Bacteroidia bacterium]
MSGRIVDSLQSPVPYAIVALLHSGDSAVVQGKITDGDGRYTFSDVQSGRYVLKVSATGYSDNYSAELNKDSMQDLTVPDLTPGKTLQLSAVTISTITPTVQFTNGNITVNVENSPIARGNSVYDLLSKLPGVGIENNSITIQGKAGVILMIDGRVQQVSDEQLMTVLKGMSAATIQKIEILKNPPLKYDAAGTSGMINIVT